MADPKSTDPVARESTRLYCAAVNGAQVSLDPKVVREWLPNYTYGAHAFGLKNLDEVEKQRDKLAAWIKEYSPIEPRHQGRPADRPVLRRRQGGEGRRSPPGPDALPDPGPEAGREAQGDRRGSGLPLEHGAEHETSHARPRF